MATYLKLFETHTQYETFIGGGGDTPFVKPNVSYCTEENEVYYNPRTWADEYLTFVALEKGTISFDILNSIGTDKITSISYSTDNGANWTTTENRNDKQENLSITVNVNKGDKILWKGDAKTLGFFDDVEEFGIGSFFSSTAKFDAAGNVMSLIYGDEYKNKITIEKEYTFCFLFCGYNFEKTCGIVNAKNLSLPATTLASSCYNCMFFGCTGLTTAPKLPATTLASGCYSGMFGGCTSLVTAPTLPATTLANSCYQSMFYDCTSLVTAPTLPATTLASRCYNCMFYGCTNLVNAPELTATTLAEGCYEGMFYNCSSLNYIKCLATNISASNCLINWVLGVASTGTFVKAASMTSWRNGFNGIPSGWTVQDVTVTV